MTAELINSCDFICQKTDIRVKIDDKTHRTESKVKNTPKDSPEILRRIFWCNMNFWEWNCLQPINPEVTT